ncbi:MAG: hypothetical protein KF740_19445 [Ramlibacter sp.]|nr:hypothetical protein [Ramlibacter sp.]
MTKRIQILKTGPLQDKQWEGRSYKSQTCECVLINEDSTVDGVGVLRLGSELQGDKAPGPGLYEPVFAPVISPKDRKIGAVLVAVTAVQPRRVPTPSSSS